MMFALCLFGRCILDLSHKLILLVSDQMQWQRKSVKDIRRIISELLRAVLHTWYLVEVVFRSVTTPTGT